jgi:hypothetical protein
MGDTSFVFHGDSHFIQTGENAKGVQNNYKNGDNPIDLEAFLKALEATVKEVEPQQIETLPEHPEILYGDVRNTAYNAEGKEEYDIEHTQTVLQRFQAFVTKAGPKLTKALLAFGTTTATAYIGDNPIAKGVIAAIQALQEPE